MRRHDEIAGMQAGDGDMLEGDAVAIVERDQRVDAGCRGMAAKPATNIGAIHERKRPEIDMVLSRLEIRDRIGARLVSGMNKWSALTPPVNVSVWPVAKMTSLPDVPVKATFGPAPPWLKMKWTLSVWPKLSATVNVTNRLRLRAVGIVGNAAVQRRIDPRNSRKGTRACRRGHAASCVPGRRRYRERVGRCGGVGIADIEPGNLGNAVAEFGDAELVGSDHRPGRADGRCIRRADERDGQRLASGMTMTVTDFGVELDLQHVACMQEAEIDVGRLIGPLQDNRSAVAEHAVERYVGGIHQRRYVDAARQRRRSVVLDRGIAGHERRQCVADIQIMVAGVPVTGASFVVAGGMYPAEMLSISNAFEVLPSTTLLKECRPENSTYPFEANEGPFGNSGVISAPV